jgi:hypothetical protein
VASAHAVAVDRNSGTVWVAGLDTIGGGEERVRFSQDGGSHWNQSDFVSSSTYTIYQMGVEFGVPIWVGTDGSGNFITRAYHTGTWTPTSSQWTAPHASQFNAVFSDYSTMYAVGSAEDASSLFHGAVYKSTDGIAWSATADPTTAFFYLSTTTNLNGGTFDFNGNLFVVGTGSSSGLIYKSTNGGTSWAQVDTAGSYAYNGVASDPRGNIMVVGSSSSGVDWSARMRDAGTGAYTSEDKFAYPGAATTTAEGVVYVPQSNRFFVVGYASNRWLVRTTDDGGKTWTMSDDFVNNGSTMPYNIAAAPNGDVYAVGSGGASTHWIVRKLPCN